MIKTAINILIKYREYFLIGIKNTLTLALVGTIVGLIIGLINGLIRTLPTSSNPIVRFIQKVINLFISIYVEIFRGTPMMVQAMVIYWGYAFYKGEVLDLMVAGLIIVSINTGAYMTEIVRGGIISIDKGQFEGAYSIGMNHFQTMLYVVFPQVMRNILPSASNELINNIKDSSVLNVIGVNELYMYAFIIKTQSYKIFETYFALCFVYLCLTFTSTRLLRWWEKKLQGSDNFQVVLKGDK